VLEEKVMTFTKWFTGRTRGWLIGGAAAFGLALMLTGCVVEAGGGGREHWHGWHEWR
jgi:hypothetical protein